MVKNKSVYQLLAEKLLGKEEAKKKHSDLYSGKPINLTIEGVQAKVGWAQYLRKNMQPISDIEKEQIGRGASFWTHIWTTYTSIWHVELRNPFEWRRVPTKKEFLWMALALLSIDKPSKLSGVRSAMCISIWANSTDMGEPLGWLGDPLEDD